MDRHLSREEVFFLVNDWESTPEVKEHLSNCAHCQALVEEEKALNGLMQETVQPVQEVDLAQGVVNRLNQGPKFIPLTSRSLQGAVLLMALALLLTSLVSLLGDHFSVEGPETRYFTLSLIVMMSLFMLDAALNYLRARRV